MNNMTSIYENEEVMKVLSVSVDSAIKNMTNKVEPIDRPIGEISMFMRFLSTSYENDDLLFLYSLTNFLASMYTTVKGRLEFTRGRMLEEGRKDKEFEKVNAKIDETDEKGRDIFRETLINLKIALATKEEKQIIDVFKKSHIRMVKEIVDKYGY